MSQRKSSPIAEKTGLHPRNLHRNRYDFDLLTTACPALLPFVFFNEFNLQTIDFADPKAVKLLNRALLQAYYGINNWEIPPQFLCPPVPSRADYIHNIADLLSEKGSTKHPIRILDIGVGANCIYPIIGRASYGWQFVGTDIDPKAIASANNIIATNASLSGGVECRLQSSPNDIFKNIIHAGEFFDASICNPPFHTSLAEAQVGTKRKWRNLGIKPTENPTLNFGGQNAELWCAGGEAAFIQKMIVQSAKIPNSCGWFTTLVSKKDNLPSIYTSLRQQNAAQIRTIDMSQGQKISRIVAWSFANC